MTFDIRTELQKLPHSPGVYIMRDEADTIMYVGKAIDLHNRVRSYFGTRVTGRGAQIQQMVSLVARFEVIVTDSEMEALILENNLIKENRPRYNTLLKDDKTYPYIRVSVQEPYPRVQLSRLVKRDKARYFGPFTSAQMVRMAIDLTNRLYQLRTCNRRLPKDIGRERPCLDYSIGLCCAPCEAGHVSAEEYRARVEKAIAFLEGDDRAVRDELKEKMEDAAARMAYEDAAKYRDMLTSLDVIRETQKMSDDKPDDRDIVALARDADTGDAVAQIFFVRDGRLIGRDHFFLRTQQDTKDAQVLEDFVKQFYSGTPFLPREIMLQEPLAEQALIEEWLSSRRGHRVYLRVPERGKKEKLMTLARENAQLILAQDKERLKKETGRTIGAAKEIGLLLGLSDVRRMEAYDISNTSGFLNVGSMVVYEGGRPKKSDYRKFRIRTVQGADDAGCMREMLERRFTHGLRERAASEDAAQDTRFGSFTRFPDLILMDGGKGQVSTAKAVLRELSLDIPVCGMVKDEHHRTRALYYEDAEVALDTHSEAFQLLTRIQDEVHRFAISYHRSLRGKSQVQSILDEIPGVGGVRRKALMRHFSSVENIREASVEELRKVPEISARQAEAIHAFFHPKEDART